MYYVYVTSGPYLLIELIRVFLKLQKGLPDALVQCTLLPMYIVRHWCWWENCSHNSHFTSWLYMRKSRHFLVEPPLVCKHLVNERAIITHVFKGQSPLISYNYPIRSYQTLVVSHFMNSWHILQSSIMYGMCSSHHVSCVRNNYGECSWTSWSCRRRSCWCFIGCCHW